ncbi:MAG TPA: AIM24 family protein, partial [Pyrinomonadaceae bacterium]|nr:AIM24 family protein [Pyrinomonadaceae bacterium]
MNCPKCGAALLAGAIFCGGCGYRLEAGNAASAPQPQAGGFAQGRGIHIDEDSRGQGGGYRYQVLHQPAFSLAEIKLQAEQSIQAEAGAMVSMSANVELLSQMKGGLFGALKRAAGGESAFVSTFTAR